jgi:integrase
MCGVRCTVAAREGKVPATADVPKQMLSLCLETLAGARDRALLALGFAGAFRRSELVALEVIDLAETPDGLRITIRRSKTDQEGQGAEIAIPRGYRLRRSRPSKRGLPPPRSAAGPCSVRWRRAAACRRYRSRHTARPLTGNADNSVR